MHALGLETAQGLVLTESFYWDLNDRTRAFTERLAEAPKDHRRTWSRPATTPATLHYLKAVADMGVPAPRPPASSLNRMKAMPTDDDAFGPGTIREDGRKLCPAYLFAGEDAGREQGARGTTTSCCRPRRPTRPSAR